MVTTLGVLISLSARELRHLLARLVWPPPTDPARVWAWSLCGVGIRPAPAARTGSVASHSPTPPK